MDAGDTRRIGASGSRRVGDGSGGRRVLALAGVSVFGVVLIAGLAWLRWLNVTPNITIPSPPMPFPNARDYYIAAGLAVVRDADVDRASIGSRTARNGPDGRPLPPVTDAERDAVLRENGPALKKLRQGFEHEYWELPARSWSSQFPHYARYRGLARVLRLEGQRRAARRDWSGALSSTLDAIRLGEDCGRGSVLIGMLVGVAVQAIGRRDAWTYIPHLGAAESRKAARRLEAITERHFGFADTLQEEKWAGQAGLMEVFRQRDWQQSLLRNLSGGGGGTGAAPPNWQDIQHRARMLAVSKSQVMANYSSYMDGLIANARQPYSAKLPAPPIPKDPINEILLPVFDQARFSEVRAVTMNRLLLLSLALRAFQAERGRYPERLHELAPGYLRKLPADDFAPNGTFRYRRKASGYLLYSLGPDGMDDGGAPAANPRGRGGSGSSPGQFLVARDSTGDIVAGVNH